jgi:hypothetical protein
MQSYVKLPRSIWKYIFVPGEFESVTSKIFSLSHTFLQINKTTYLNNKKI